MRVGANANSFGPRFILLEKIPRVHEPCNENTGWDRECPLRESELGAMEFVK